jgi:hypothetical protein
VYIWDREKGDLLQRLRHHSGLAYQMVRLFNDRFGMRDKVFLLVVAMIVLLRHGVMTSKSNKWNI